MPALSDHVQKFFEDYERSLAQPGVDGAAASYADSFLFAGPQGATAVPKAGFLKVLPKRSEFFKAAGLVSSKIQSLEETRLDYSYLLVRAVWVMTFEKDPGHPTVIEAATTYILYHRENSVQIVFQLDHQDLAKMVQESDLL